MSLRHCEALCEEAEVHPGSLLPLVGILTDRQHFNTCLGQELCPWLKRFISPVFHVQHVQPDSCTPVFRLSRPARVTQEARGQPIPDTVSHTRTFKDAKEGIKKDKELLAVTPESSTSSSLQPDSASSSDDEDEEDEDEEEEEDCSASTASSSLSSPEIFRREIYGWEDFYTSATT